MWVLVATIVIAAIVYIIYNDKECRRIVRELEDENTSENKK